MTARSRNVPSRFRTIGRSPRTAGMDLNFTFFPSCLRAFYWYLCAIAIEKYIREIRKDGILRSICRSRPKGEWRNEAGGWRLYANVLHNRIVPFPKRIAHYAGIRMLCQMQYLRTPYDVCPSRRISNIGNRRKMFAKL